LLTLLNKANNSLKNYNIIKKIILKLKKYKINIKKYKTNIEKISKNNKKRFKFFKNTGIYDKYKAIPNFRLNF